jgi:hypothetical protein
MRGAIPPLLNTPSWRSAQLKNKRIGPSSFLPDMAVKKAYMTSEILVLMESSWAVCLVHAAEYEARIISHKS